VVEELTKFIDGSMDERTERIKSLFDKLIENMIWDIVKKIARYAD